MAEQSSGGSGITKWLFLALGVGALFYFGWPLLFGSKGPDRQPLTLENDWGTTPEGDRPEEEVCELAGARSTFSVTSRGGAVKSARMLDPKYAQQVDKPDTRIELVTTSKEQRMPLRTSLRVPAKEGVEQQVDFDNLDFDYVPEKSTDSSCYFAYETEGASVEKVVSLTERPFELDVTVTVTNKSSSAKKHRYAVEQTSWRSATETSSSFWDLGRSPEWQTEVVTHTSKKTKREMEGAFEPGDFDPEDGYTAEHFLRAEGDGVWASVSTTYFAATVIDKASSGGVPAAEVLIEDGQFYKLPKGDKNFGHMYRARLAYPEKELGPGESASYETLAFFGPKERQVLAVVGGQASSGRIKMVEQIDLGMFGFLGGIFVNFVLWLHKMVGSWGWAICLLTMTVKMGVFPLQLPSLKTQVAMRRLKPQIDELTAKYRDDMMQKNLAMQELYKREGIRPMLGCFPLLLQMPVWISLYQALGTAVELYHAPFGPLIPDLTHSDPYHVIPIVLGASSFLQQKLMPAQGMDPQQQKMMLYLMPAIFTIMMFFLPAGLGVYMLTNTWLGIIQQFLVERWISSKVKGPASIQVREITKSAGDAPALGKGKARARG